jgi:protease IV
MWQFIKYVFATIIGIFLFTILAFFLMIGIGAAVSSSSEEKTTVKENSVLKLNLNKAISEDVPEDPFGPFAEAFGNDNLTAGLFQIKDALRNAKADANVKGIYLQANYPQAGWAALEEVRNALIDFKKSGKFIYSYGEVYDEKGYYLSSVSDKIFLNPAGGMEFNGLNAEYTFFKGSLDKLGVEPIVFRVGDYKSAVEPFVRENMSEPNREQIKSFLGVINNHVFSKIAESRNLSVADLNRIADSLKVENPQGALQSKLVTDLGYYDEFEADLKKRLKVSDEKKIDFLSLEKYLKAEKTVKEGSLENRIAVIVAEGEIVSGKGDDGQIGSDKFAAEIRKARLDKKVKAVVLRINSPGGSALASDVMWREITLTAKSKPIIASMSDYATSGGYYMAMGCNKIVAQPTTITANIGIFGLLFNSEKFMKDKLGITFDRVSTNAHSDWPSVTRNMSDFEKAMIQKSINQGYETFTSKAAQGRKMPLEKLKSLANGRVWSGSEAKANGLVDALGGFDDAVKMAAQAAKLKEGDYRLRFSPTKKNFWEGVLDKASDEAETRTLKAQFGDLAPYVRQVQQLRTLEGIQARLPFQMDIR